MINVRKNEPIDKALRRFKKKIDKEGTIKILRDRQHYEKPSQKKRRKIAKAKSKAIRTVKG
mgnify:CR=1 FL=1